MNRPFWFINGLFTRLNAQETGLKVKAFLFSSIISLR